MVCIGIGIVIVSFYALLLVGSGYGFGIPFRYETRQSAVSERRPSGEERMG
ncbi:hypothetical protein ACIU1J_28865 [Azospirillum doebereinerae]|uniref:hypothetical protein n=1 Tax=Azospirillum doebereinerae TaxID=92933 RepID=UPI001EE5974B|nr:hypothetical protein [Azospirillum doebereinerae]MCG5239371.1 hypothetical protein [Azospirillum doebereinerae]